MYRDEEEAAAHRVDALSERVRARKARLTPPLLKRLPQDLSSRMTQGVEHVDACTNVGDRVRALETLDGILDEVFALAPHLEDDVNALPEEIAPEMVVEARRLPLFHTTPEGWDEAVSRLPRYLTELDAGTRIDRKEACVLDARLAYRGAPVAARMQPHFQSNEYTGEVEVALGSPVRKSTPALDVRPLAFSHSFTKLLRIHRDIEIGDEQIDGRFLIQGDVAFAKAVLSDKTRADLLKIATFDVPFLDVADRNDLRVVRLRWRWDAKVGPLKAALRILARIRALDTSVQMISSTDPE